jgi:hypothetical protein
MVKKRTPQRTLAEMSVLIEAWGASGQSRAAFCRAHGIGVCTFQYWQRRCQGNRVNNRVSANFVEIPPPPERAAGGTIRIKHPNGVELELDSTVSVTFLRDLLQW